MLKTKLFLLVTYFAVISLADAQEIGPLPQEDSAEYLVTLAAKKLASSPQQAEALIRRAHAHAVDAKYVTGEGKALFVWGRALSAVNKNKESIDAYLKAARLFESLKDSTRAGRSYNGAAGIYIYKLFHHTKAYEYCTKAVALLQHDSIYLPAALTNLAALHLQTGKLDEALEIYKKSYEAERKHNNLVGMCIALNNIATSYEGKKDFKSSLLYYKKALEISRALGDEKQTAHILTGLAPIYTRLKDYQKMKEALDELMALSKKHSMFDKRVLALGCLAAESHQRGKKDQALAYALEAKRTAELHGLQAYKGSIYKQLSDIYKKADKPKLALHYHHKYAQFQDSLANQERLAVASLDFEKNDDSASTKNIKDSIFRGDSILALGAGILISGMFFIYYKKKRERDTSQDHALRKSQYTLQDHLPGTKEIKETDDDPSHPGIEHLEVINGEGIKLLPLNNIWWFQKDEKAYRAFTENRNYRIRQNITELERALPKNRFFRVNRTVIINIDQMSNYSFWENHKYIIRMKNVEKSEFVISRSRLRDMKEAFRVLEGS